MKFLSKSKINVNHYYLGSVISLTCIIKNVTYSVLRNKKDITSENCSVLDK